jgi:hypothetical protein
MKPPLQVLKQIYWSLGDDWWKQIIDGDCHFLGPEVFDKGLHGGPVEPGFLASLRKGMEFSAEQLQQPLTLDSYCALHRILCAHLHGTPPPFRDHSLYAVTSLKSAFGPEVFRHYLIIELFETFERAKPYRRIPPGETASLVFLDILNGWEKSLASQSPRKFLKSKPILQELRSMNHPLAYCEKEAIESRSWIQRWEKSWEVKIKGLNACTRRIAESYGSPPWVEFSLTRVNFVDDFQVPAIKVTHHALPTQAYPLILNKLFQDFHRKIQLFDKNLKAKIRIHADLYQQLEWLHCFSDGQGRTDLVTLSRALTSHGLHPLVMERPYFSYTAFLEEWVDEMEAGLLAWKKLLSTPILSTTHARKPSTKASIHVKIRFLYREFFMRVINKPEAQQVFWNLGGNSWKQVIPAEYHSQGSKQLDSGEFNSLTQGMRLASEHLGEPLTPEFYLDCYRTFSATAPTSPLELFRNKPVIKQHSLRADLSETSLEHYFFSEVYHAGLAALKYHAASPMLDLNRKDTAYQIRANDWQLKIKHSNPKSILWLSEFMKTILSRPHLSQLIEENHPKSEQWLQNWTEQWKTRVQTLNQEMQTIAATLSCPPLAKFTLADRHIHVTYLIDDPQVHQRVLEAIFSQYNAKIAQAQAPDNKLHAIAEVYRLLEWLHPCDEWQTLLHQTILSKLLTEQGFTPAIIEKPGMVNLSTENEVVERIKKGMETWAKEPPLEIPAEKQERPLRAKM